jgi:hypothetical protein
VFSIKSGATVAKDGGFVQNRNLPWRFPEYERTPAVLKMETRKNIASSGLAETRSTWI